MAVARLTSGHNSSRISALVSPQEPALNLIRALDDYEKCLNDEEKEDFRSVGKPDEWAAAKLTGMINKSYEDGRQQCMGTRFMTLLQSMQQFSTIVDTFVTSHPEIAALAWGGIRLALLTVNNATSYFEKMSEFFMKIGSTCPRFDKYRSLYPHSIEVQTALCNYYAGVIRLCRHSIESSRRSSSIRVVVAVFIPFEREFDRFDRELHSLSKEFKEAVKIASCEAEGKSSQLQQEMYQEQKQQSTTLAIIKNRLFQTNSRDLERMMSVEKTRILDDEKSRLLNVFSTHNYESSWSQLCKDRTPGTSIWILETEMFQSWKAAMLEIVWCCGRLGSGKSVISALVFADIIETKSDQDDASYFFCRPEDEQSLRARTIIGTIAKQLARKIPAGEFSDLQGNDFEAAAIISFLIRKLSRSCRYYIVIDGLDECNETQMMETVELLSRFHASPIRVSIYFSSRPSLLNELPQNFQPDNIINMEDPQIHAKLAHDMRQFIERDLEVTNSGMESIILQKLQDGAEGMFLWVKLQLQTLRKANSNSQLLTALRNLPQGLSETYERILKQIDPQDSDCAIKVFRWVAAAKRPLSIGELREAIAIKPLGEAGDADELLHDMVKAISCCGNLAFVDEENLTVHFTHSSVKHYLTSQDVHESVKKYGLSILDTNEEVGIACVTYLNFSRGAVAKQQPSTELFEELPYFVERRSSPLGKYTRKIIAHEARRRLQSNERTKRVLQETAGDTEESREEIEFERDVFRPYAEQFWLQHTKQRIDPTASRRLWALWRMLVYSPEWWQKCVGVTWNGGEWKCRSERVLNWTVQQDHCSLAQYLATSEPTLSDDQLAILLNGAVANGHHDLVNLYLNSRREFPSHHLDFALFEACRCGPLAMVDHLLTTQADADGKSSDYNKPLRIAAASGFLDIVERLLKESPDVDVQDRIIPERTPIQAAAEKGHLEVVEILLENGADVNASASCEDKGRTALQAAAGGGHELVLISLLQSGAKINAPPGESDGRTALQAAAEIGHVGIMSKLMDSPSPSSLEKADVNAPISNFGGRTALQAAAGNGHENAVSFLIAEGANVNASSRVGRCGRTALQAAAEKGHLTVVNILFAAGDKADVNAPAGFEEGRTALQAAAGSGHLHVTDRLLAEGADCNASPADLGGRTALQAAAEHGHAEIVRRLLEAGAEVNAPPSAEGGLTALQAASKFGELDLIDLFLSSKHDANVNAVACDKDGLTALQAAAAGGHLKAIDRLLKKGADINGPAGKVNGRTGLQAAAEGGYLTAVRRLIQKGADINAMGSPRQGRTAIQAAAEGGHEKVVKELLQAGALVNTPLQELGATALRAAAEGGFLNVVRILLEAGATDAAEKGTVLGMTARYAAMLGRHAEVERCLEEAGLQK